MGLHEAEVLDHRMTMERAEFPRDTHHHRFRLRTLELDFSLAEIGFRAVKRAEDDPNTLIVRFFNITDEPVTNARVTVRGATSARLVNLNEEPQEELSLDAEGAIVLSLIRPKQIVTLGFRCPISNPPLT
jgi:alpha-mannosidase